MKRIVVALMAALLVIVSGTGGLYLLSRQPAPPSEPLGPQPPGNVFGGGGPGQPQAGPPLQPQGGIQAQAGPLAQQQGGIDKPPLVPLTDEQRQIILRVAQEDTTVATLEERLGIVDFRVEDNGIRLPLGVVGTVQGRGPEWDMRVVVDIERGEVTTIHIERQRGKPQPQEFQNLEEIAGVVAKAEQNPAVARRLEGKKYMTHVLPPTAEGIVGVGFIDRQTKRLLFIAEVNRRSGEVRMREGSPQPQGQRAPLEGGIAPRPIQAWQVVALLLLATLVGGLVYMVVSAHDKESPAEIERDIKR